MCVEPAKSYRGSAFACHFGVESHSYKYLGGQGAPKLRTKQGPQKSIRSGKSPCLRTLRAVYALQSRTACTYHPPPNYSPSEVDRIWPWV